MCVVVGIESCNIRGGSLWGACPILAPENALYFIPLLLEIVAVPEGWDVPSPGAVDDLLPTPLNPEGVGLWHWAVGNYCAQESHRLLPCLIQLALVFWTPWKDNPLLIQKTCVAPLLMCSLPSQKMSDVQRSNTCRGVSVGPLNYVKGSKMSVRASESLFKY